MKLLIIFVFSVSFLFGADVKKDVDFNDLFSQLDKVISAKKNTSTVKKSKKKYTKKRTSKREKNYKKFNEAAKKYHIFRAKRILKTVNKLIVDYEKKVIMDVSVRRYSFIGEKKFAYVSGKELNNALKVLEENGKTLVNLKKYKSLLASIKEYDIKTIAKVLIIVEQEIMNLSGMGIKKVAKLRKKDIADIPMLLHYNKFFNNVKVISVSRNTAKLKSIAN